jgi:CubicO group peptidase (beta-lactamase class C family)
VGASFCATKDGETVVDLWGGFADAEKTRPWERDTIVNVYSTTKTMTFLCALILADRGELDFDAPVAKYWPEFAANGKAEIKVSNLMAHTAGLSGWREKIKTEDLYDWEKVTALLAAQAPLWPPGTQSGYHAITQGYLVGEVVRRISGKSFGTFFRDEVATPLGADFWVGLPASEDHRVADLIPPPPGGAIGDMELDEIGKITFNNPGVDVSATRSRAWRGAEIPAAGGTGNARSIARIHGILANGGVMDGKRFLSEAGCRKALEVQYEGQDLIFKGPVKLGMGFGLPGPMVPLPHPNSLFWGGYGGSLIIIDMDAHTTFGYAMNKMGGGTVGDQRAFGMIGAMWQALG